LTGQFAPAISADGYRQVRFGDRLTVSGRAQRRKAADVDYPANAGIDLSAYPVEVAASLFIDGKKLKRDAATSTGYALRSIPALAG